MNCRMHIRIEGRVQGVGFRYSAREKAGELGLHGWVRNLYDSEVEIMVEGGREMVNEFLDWCRVGPPSAIVRRVTVNEESVSGDLAGFDVLPTVRHGR